MNAKAHRVTAKSAKEKNTRDLLISAGLEAFAKFGPEGVTTRQLAKAAGVNSAAIAYYFGGKEGYYLAAVKHLIREEVSPALSRLAEIAEELRSSRKTPEVAADLLTKFVRFVILTMLLNPDVRHMASISSREHLHPTSAFEVLYREAVLPMHTTLTELSACATNTQADSPENAIRAHAILGQITFFRIAGSSLCRHLEWDVISEERAELVARIVGEMACRAVGLPPVE